VPNLWLDTETFCETPIKWGTYRYAEKVEVMLLQWAIDDGEVHVWDMTAPYDHMHPALFEVINDPSTLVWFQNGDKFDWPVLEHAMPWLAQAVPIERRRDTMVQAYCHSLPGNLEMMCAALGVEDDKAKSKEGKRLIRLFCMPQKTGPHPRATRLTNPTEWEEFKAYAVQDIVAMRECHRRMPMWNYKGKQLDLWFLDQRMNARGMQMDTDLAEAAVRASDIAKKQLAVQTRELTHEGVQSATQRDSLLAWILEAYGVDLPDMTAATLERRIKDDDLPEELRELMRVRLQSTTTSVAKYTTLLNGVNSDGRLRGASQFRGAMRTGRVAHRLFQPGNMPRPDMPTDEIMWAIELLKLDAAQLVFDNVMRVCSNAIRSTIIPGPGRKLVVADLANIEGRVAAWLAGEAWKLQAFKDYDTIIGHDDESKAIRKGPDLYVLAYASAFNVDPATVGKGPKRQIGKVQELMFQYGGGVGAWITGAATYGIDLAQMTEQVWDTLPAWAKDEAESFLQWLYEDALDAYARAGKRAAEKVELLICSAEDAMVELDAAAIRRDAKMKKVRFGLTEKTFIACDAIKRLWRKANPQISSYWKEIENAIEIALGEKGKQLQCRTLKIRCDGAWLRVGLPSGRVLCYPQPMWDAQVKRADGTVKSYPGFSYMGISAYTKKWQRIGSYGGKVFENVVQAAACDVLLETGEPIEAAGFEPVMSVHDEWICEAPIDRDDLSAELLGRLMCIDLGWNAGLPLAAAGFETQRYHKEQ
jgi:DNA polymerase